LIYTIDSKTYPLISSIANNSHSYKAGTEIVNLGNKAGMRNTYTLHSILQAVKCTALKAIANGVDTEKNKYVYKKECLGIMYMDIEKS
jgi:hypothetical protein